MMIGHTADAAHFRDAEVNSHAKDESWPFLAASFSKIQYTGHDFLAVALRIMFTRFNARRYAR